MSTIPAQAASHEATQVWSTTDYQASSFGYDTSGGQGYDTSGSQSGHWGTPGYGVGSPETGAYDATAWNSVPQEELPQQLQPEAAYTYGYEQQPQHAYEATAVFEVPTDLASAPTATFEAVHPEHLSVPVPAPVEDVADAHGMYEAQDASDTPEVLDALDPLDPQDVHAAETQIMTVAPAAPAEPSVPRSARRAAAKGGSSRRRTPAKRSALLTVAVPSACVMGVAGVAAASVSGLTGGQQPSEDTTTMAAPDPASVKPVAANNKLDTQLAALSADAGDFADRASRTQERIDLRERQELEKKKREAEAAAKEAARPKFSLPVAQHGLSAGYGQSGVNWMSLHTGIDFPVAYGTAVMAATDGTVRTQWNSAYGNMVILTAPDGTETWYCHLSTAKIRSGKVKAGDVIAYSGNSGNSTGPHLHFEVRPGGGSPVDPSSWLRAHGLNPN
ncbi:peptidoglycan DD-metalloendopeptidase family protein [Streptomyces bambusae]|uniref:Peptidoglycan DD-metalloendopeptidase family protein n=2 Tax=Streptomyces bambusae TaxID=1550616 RepID=A0ABS6ZFV4_9ACTN|nr:peptidoglycan DD-metalloendopeptidase family protein [Streptomyces bambusae]